MPPEIEKNLNGIVPDLIELSIDYTQKYIKDQMNTLTKTLRTHETKIQSRLNKKGKKIKNNQTNINIIEMREDLPYEKLEREEKLKKEKEAKEKNKKESMNKNTSKINDNNSQKKEKETDKEKEKEKGSRTKGPRRIQSPRKENGAVSGRGRKKSEGKGSCTN